MKVLSSALAFAFVSTIAAIPLAFALDGLYQPGAILSLGAGAIAAGFAWRQTAPAKAPKPEAWDWFMLAVWAMVSFRAFGWLVYTNGNTINVLSPNNLGDICLHIDFIRYLASGVPFWPESPILSGVPLTYPLGSDLFNALGQVLGLDTFRGLIGVGLAGAALTGFALWRWGGAFALAALLFNGGLAGFVFLHSGQFADFQSDLMWKNFFLSMLVTQRGLLFALPAGLLLLTAWRDAFFRQRPGRLPVWLQFVLYAGMPLFNVHAFLFLSFILAGIFLFQPTARRTLLLLVGASFIPATTAICLITGRFSVSSGLRWFPHWMMEDEGWKVWIWDFGLTLPLIAMLCVFLFWKKDREARCFVWVAAAIFVLGCLVAFAPWPWDNMKLLLWSWLVIAPYLWNLLLSPWPRWVGAVVCVGLFFSGAVSLVGGLASRSDLVIAKRSELDAWQAAVAGIPPESRFACIPDYNHPLILLGRKVVCGYEGHLWSHGLNYKDKLAELKNAFAGTVDWTTAARDLQMDWIAVRTSDFGAINLSSLALPMGDTGTLYDLRPLLTTPPSPDSQSPLQPQPQRVDLSW